METDLNIPFTGIIWILYNIHGNSTSQLVSCVWNLCTSVTLKPIRKWKVKEREKKYSSPYLHYYSFLLLTSDVYKLLVEDHSSEGSLNLKAFFFQTRGIVGERELHWTRLKDQHNQTKLSASVPRWCRWWESRSPGRCPVSRPPWSSSRTKSMPSTTARSSNCGRQNGCTKKRLLLHLYCE